MECFTVLTECNHLLRLLDVLFGCNFRASRKSLSFLIYKYIAKGHCNLCFNIFYLTPCYCGKGMIARDFKTNPASFTLAIEKFRFWRV